MTVYRLSTVIIYSTAYRLPIWIAYKISYKPSLYFGIPGVLPVHFAVAYLEENTSIGPISHRTSHFTMI